MAKIKYISVEQNRLGFGDFFGGWVIMPQDPSQPTFLVDVTTAEPAAKFVKALKDFGVEKLDYILISHIHIDHAGALAEVLEAYPDAKAVAHQRGLGHLINPERLWASTKEVMAELAPMYGAPTPVPKEKLIGHLEADIKEVTIIETPGHAPHHLSFIIADVMFAGEAGGTPYKDEGILYSRPATPPRFFPQVTLDSLEKLKKYPDMPAYFGHCLEKMPLYEIIDKYKKQINYWLDYIKPLAQAQKGESQEKHIERLTLQLFQDDPSLQPLNKKKDIAFWREKFFIQNSVLGFVDFFQREAKSV